MEAKEYKGHKYLCVNPNCRKVFSRPKIIKYQVCPACQTLVDTAVIEKQSETSRSSASKPVKRKKQKKVEADHSEEATLEVQPVSVEPLLEEPAVPEKKPEGNEEGISLVPIQTPQQGKDEMPPIQQTKTCEAETVSPSSTNCQYRFGYLNQRKKGEEIPDTCIECPKLLNCMLSDYYKKEESLAEIKKWYAT